MLGTATSLAAGRLLAGRFFDVPAWDGATLAVVSVLLFTTALAASWFPARRATRVDAVEVLRSE